MNEMPIENYVYNECGLFNIVLRDMIVRECPYCDCKHVVVPNELALKDRIARELTVKLGRLTNCEVDYLIRYTGYHEMDIAEMICRKTSTVKGWRYGTVRMTDDDEMLFRLVMLQRFKIKDYNVFAVTLSKKKPSVMFFRMNEKREWIRLIVQRD
jgi:hypothetical protein